MRAGGRQLRSSEVDASGGGRQPRNARCACAGAYANVQRRAAADRDDVNLIGDRAG